MGANLLQTDKPFYRALEPGRRIFVFLQSLESLLLQDYPLYGVPDELPLSYGGLFGAGCS